MDNVQRLKFDVACALAILGPRSELAVTLPDQFGLDSRSQKLLDDCVAPDSYTSNSCKIRVDLDSDLNYFLELGNDKLTLYPDGEVRAGGSGVTIRLFDKTLERSFALKVPRVSVLAYVAPEYKSRYDKPILERRIMSEYRAFENERLISRLLSHENVARHYYGDKKPIPDVSDPGQELYLPYSISEWIALPRPLHLFLKDERPDVSTIISMIHASFSALSHVHAQEIVHWDIKSDNILVSEDGVPKLIDFGNAKLITKAGESLQTATTSEGKYPIISEFTPAAVNAEGSKRYHLTVTNTTWAHPYVDLWMLAQEWNRCLLTSEHYCSGTCDLSSTDRDSMIDFMKRSESSRTADAWECLRIIFDRVLSPFSSDRIEDLRGINGDFKLSALYYRSAREILQELSRILPPFGDAQGVSELLVSLDEIVRLPVTGNSVFTERVAAIVDSELIQPTSGHLQLAQVKRVFPGATHTRFEHLLGTVTTAAYILRSLYLNDLNSFWRVSAEAGDIRAVLLAATLHDSGHLAFGHFIEEMTDLMVGSKHEDFIPFLLARCAATLKSGRAKEFAAFGLNHFSMPESEVAEVVGILRAHWCSDDGKEGTDDQVLLLLQKVLLIFNHRRKPVDAKAYLTKEGTGEALAGILQSVVDGPIDADKLDYLRRDSLHSGVFFSQGIDLERFFESLRVCVATAPGESPMIAAIGVSEKGVTPIETIITARYHLFSSVYWHRTVRLITGVLQRSISEVRRKLDDEGWERFLSEFLDKFRRLDDRAALVWLKEHLDSRKLLTDFLTESSVPPGSEDKHLRMKDLLDLLLGASRKSLRMAFELGYEGPADPSSIVGKTATEQLHQRICSEVYPGAATQTLPEMTAWASKSA